MKVLKFEVSIDQFFLQAVRLFVLIVQKFGRILVYFKTQKIFRALFERKKNKNL
jgi:hypothetical protein